MLALHDFVNSFCTEASSSVANVSDLRNELLVNMKALMFNAINWHLCTVIEKVYWVGFGALKASENSASAG